MKNPQKQIQWQELVDELQASDLPDVEKILQAYDFIVDQHIDHCLHEIELARAMQDNESVIREQIKMETLKFSQKRLRELQMIFSGSER